MIIIEALSHGPRTSKEIQASTNWSQGKVSRIVRDQDDIIQMPGRRPHQYALTKPTFGATYVPIATIDTHGKNIPRGILNAIQPEGYVLSGLPGASVLLAGESREGRFDGLPYFMDDARPQGFLGKLIAQQLAEQSNDFSPDPDLWSDELVGRYLLSNGDDLPGDFVFGYSMMNRLRRAPHIYCREEYSKIAETTLDGFTAGSSAGGEQQKFTAFISDIESHVIVKFSPAQSDLTSTRWRDILVTEYHALSVLSETGYPTAETKLIDSSGRYFLESKRFDRRGRFGRSSMFSLRTIDAEFVGSGGSWPDVINGLVNENMATPFDLFAAQELFAFGQLIQNTDMHLGNLSVTIDGDMFSLLPVYDMCSMGFAPKGTEVSPLTYKLPNRDSVVLPSHSADRIVQAAITFWERVEQDPMASEELRSLVKTADIVEQLSNFQN